MSCKSLRGAMVVGPDSAPGGRGFESGVASVGGRLLISRRPSRLGGGGGGGLPAEPPPTKKFYGRTSEVQP